MMVEEAAGDHGNHCNLSINIIINIFLLIIIEYKILKKGNPKCDM